MQLGQLVYIPPLGRVFQYFAPSLDANPSFLEVTVTNSQ